MTNREARDLYYSVRYNLTNPKHKEAVDVAFAALERQEESAPTEEIALEMTDKRAADILLNANLGGVLAWISVKDALPEPDVSVLVIVNGKPHKNITLVGAYELAEFDSEEGWILEMWPEWMNAEVSHWMPLPEPPKEEV